MKDQIDILLATYQGEPYLSEQLHSIFHQTYPYFHIYIRDDGSTDRTLSIINSFSQAYPNKITLLQTTERLGIKGNFSQLMRHASSSYVMFSDQDDYWFPNKLELSLAKMKVLERIYGSDIPLLVHTDLQVVEENLTLIDPSFWHYSKINPSYSSLNRLLVQNIATGCTILMNQQLLKISYPIPDQSIMHDWWIILVAALFGKVDYINEPTLSYRQHSKNSVGAQRFKILQNILNRIIRKDSNSSQKKYEQANALLQRYSSQLNSSQLQTLNAFCSLKNLPYFKKVRQSLKHGFIPHF